MLQYMAQELRKDTTNEDSLPLIRLFKTPTAKVLDLILESYNTHFTKNEVAEINNLSLENTEIIIKNLINEGILKKEKEGLEIFYKANFSSARTEGLFRYIRATLDENFDSNLKTD